MYCLWSGHGLMISMGRSVNRNWSAQAVCALNMVELAVAGTSHHSKQRSRRGWITRGGACQKNKTCMGVRPDPRFLLRGQACETRKFLHWQI